MTPTPTPRPTRHAADADPLRPRAATEVDWPAWTRLIERKRRQIKAPRRWPGWVYRDGTRASFRLEGIAVAPADLTAALARRRALRSHGSRRLRAHLAVLRSLDLHRGAARALSPGQVLRWYTSISGGLSTAALSPAGQERLAAAVRRINSPQRRLQPAVTEAARLYAELLADPMFPGFNGILARLMLHTHLTGCGLPPVVFDADRDDWDSPTTPVVTACLLERIDASLDRMAEQ